MDRRAELERLYAALDEKLEDAKGSGAAAVVLQMRILAAELERIGETEVTKADELAARRKTKGGPPGPPSRRRVPRRGARGD